MESMTAHLFKLTKILCPSCSKLNMNDINGMMLCENCGYYVHISIAKVKVQLREDYVYYRKKPAKRKGNQYNLPKFKL